MRTILITGSTDGIGKQTALELARNGMSVIIHGRSETKCRETIDEISASVPAAKLDHVTGDLSSLRSVRLLAASVKNRTDRIDVLLNNAGVFMNEKVMTEDGFEMTFAVNHLAPFLLTRELQPLLENAQAPRVITVSSIAHRNGVIDMTNLNSERSFSGYGSYAASKLANILFTQELSERLKAKKITANCLHPGVVGTKLLKKGFNGMNGSETLEQGAETSVFLASSSEVEDVTGAYFVRKKISAVSAAANDPVIRKQLWEISERFCYSESR